MARRVLVELRRERDGRLVAHYSDGSTEQREPARDEPIIVEHKRPFLLLSHTTSRKH